MIDIGTKKSLRVSSEVAAKPYIMVPVEQLGEVKSLLDAHDIQYWVDEFAIALNDEPETTVINLRRGADPTDVQRILDSAA